MRLPRPEREAVKSVVLAALVLAAVGLNVALWMRTPGGGAPPRPGPYVAEGSGAPPPLGEVLLPLRVVTHRDGQHALLFDPAAPGYAELVAAAGRLMGAAARGPAPVPAPEGELAARRRADTGWELVLPAELPLQDWVAAWGGEDAGRGLRRAEAGGLGVRGVAFFLAERGSVLVYLEGSRGLRRLAAAPAEGVGRLAAAVAAAARQGVPASEAGGSYGHLAVSPGLFVPLGLSLPVLRAERERLDPQRLAGSVFPDMGVVRRVEGRDGSLLFTDGQQGLLLRPDGSWRYQNPSPQPAKGEGGAVRLLEEALRFVARHGGWPRGARLLAAGRDARGDASFLLGPAYQGHPLLGAVAGGSGFAPPLRVRVTSRGGIRSYERLARRFAPVPSAAPEALAADRALAALDRAWAARLGGGRATVTDLFPAFVAWEDEAARSGRGAPGGWRPAWAVALDGSLAAVVDAQDGAVAALAPDGEEVVP